MKTSRSVNLSRHRWLSAPLTSGAYQHWLTDKGSLTSRLQALAKAQSQAFSVKPKSLVNTKPSHDEAQLMQISSRQHILQREVGLYCGERCVVFAHSILPHSSLRGEWRVLGSLGARPLGAVLFADPRVKRTALSYKKLSPSHPLFLKATIGLKNTPKTLWARRSVFSLKAAKILVTEVFLPALIAK